MPRAMTSGMLAALQDSVLRPALLIEIHVKTGIVRFWTGVGNLSWGGYTWTGAGTLGTVSTIEEVSRIEAKGVVLTLSGLDPVMYVDAMQEIQTGLPALVYFALFDTSGNLIPDPIIAWSGTVDQPTIDVDGNTSSISINTESRLLDLQVQRVHRYTPDDPAIVGRGDQAFNFVASLQMQTLTWGRTPLSNSK